MALHLVTVEVRARSERQRDPGWPMRSTHPLISLSEGFKQRDLQRICEVSHCCLRSATPSSRKQTSRGYEVSMWTDPVRIGTPVVRLGTLHRCRGPCLRPVRCPPCSSSL